MRNENPPVMTPWNDQSHLAGVMDLSSVQSGPHRMKVIGSYTKPGPDVGAATRTLPVAQWTSSVRPGVFHESGSLTGVAGASSAWNLTRATARSRKNLAQIVVTGAVNRNTPNGLTAGMLSAMESPVGRSTNPADMTHDFLVKLPGTNVQVPTSSVGGFASSGLIPRAGGPVMAPRVPQTPPPLSGLPSSPPQWKIPTIPTTTPPVDPQAQLLASLFGSGGYSPISSPTPVVDQSAGSSDASGTTSPLVLWGAIASVGAVGYLVYRHFKQKKAA